MHIKIGSRGSDLALWQAHFVQAELEKLGHSVSIEIIITKGDRIQDLSFDKLEGKGFFTKEIETALLANTIDLAVHSHKDLETTNPAGLKIGAVSYRENPTDMLLIKKTVVDPNFPLSLPDNAKVGTSSARRKTQLLRFNPSLQVVDLRGNVPTRVNKLRSPNYDAIVLASAGVQRLKLDLSDFEVIELDPTAFVPAPAQGVLGLQIRSADTDLQQVLNELNHAEVAAQIKIERDVLRLLEGGCQLPLGVYCERKDDQWTVHTAFAENKNEPAILSSYETDEPGTIAELIVKDLKGETTEE